MQRYWGSQEFPYEYDVSKLQFSNSMNNQLDEVQYNAGQNTTKFIS